jgi:FK506-binding nuclear protein
LTDLYSEPATKGTKRLRETEEAPLLVDTSKTDKADTTELSKSQKKKLKKQKLNSGEAAPVNGEKKPEGEKKVQFSSKLEQGPTAGASDVKVPAKSALSPKPEAKPEKKKITLANGVTIEEHKVGSGPKAKTGTKLGIRYIGKLVKGGKEFDKNTKGKPFRFTLGKGEVIKGMHIRSFG